MSIPLKMEYEHRSHHTGRVASSTPKDVKAAESRCISGIAIIKTAAGSVVVCP